MTSRISVPRERIVEFCRRNKIRKLSLFGSILRDDFTPSSDVDVLVEFKPGANVGLFELYDLEEEFANLISVAKVDMNTPGCLSVYYRDQVLAEAETLYDQA